jgi:hypothetical protein
MTGDFALAALAFVWLVMDQSFAWLMADHWMRRRG